MKEIKLATTPADLESCYPVMKQLRPHLELESFVNQIQRQMKEGYHLAYIKHDGKIHAAAGFRFLEFLAWGKALYIDDLITDQEARKTGLASTLLSYLIKLAKEKGCKQVHLDSGPHRHDAHRLYLNHGFKIVCHHFSLELQEN